MLVIPAIDLAEGKCVRLRRGDMTQRTIYSDHPADMARHWEEQGARLLHVVDLDGAVSGASANLPAIEAIVKAISIPVELGGGLRTVDDVQRALDLGVRWAIMGTSALRNRGQVEKAVGTFREQIIVGIDAREGRVAVAGWQETSEVAAVDLARDMEAIGVGRLICTDIASDGMLTGPNIEGLKIIARAVDIPIIASGGVSCLEDVRRLQELEAFGVIGVIVGKALYEGALDLSEAIAVVRG